MSKGKKYKTPKKYLHKRPHHNGYYYKVGGGRHGKFEFKHFRHKKRFQYLMEGKLSMRKMIAIEIWFWD